MKKLYHYPSMLILSLLCVIALIVLQLSYFATQVLFKPQIYTEAIIKSRTAELICQDLDTYFGYLSTPTNIPKNVFTDPIKTEDISAAVNQLVEDSLAYITDSSAPKPQIKYDYAPLEKSITDYIDKYAAEHDDIEKDEEYDKFVRNTIDTAKEQVESRMDAILLYKIASTGYVDKLHKAADMLHTVLIASGGILLLLIIIMCIINRHHPRDMTYWYGSILFTASATLLIPLIYMKKVKFFDGFIIRSDYTYKAVTRLLNSLLDRALNFELILFVAGVLLIITTIVVHMIYIAIRRRRDSGA